MFAFYTDVFVLPLPEGHRFPMSKYRLLRERILESGLLMPDQLRTPPALTNAQLTLTHDPAYLAALESGTLSAKAIRKIGFPWSPGMVERSRRSSAATLEAARTALNGAGVSVNLAGGTHHAHYDSGGGYCVFNDAVVAIRILQAEGVIRRAVVIDADVHQGDGTASLCAEDSTIFTFSIHGEKNYPFHKPPSDLDIGLPDGTTDAEYLDQLQAGVWYALSRAGADLAIYLAGADPFEGDTLGRLKISKAGLKTRDEVVIESCLAAGIPVAVAMAGGYARDVRDTVDIHFQTVSTALHFAGG